MQTRRRKQAKKPILSSDSDSESDEVSNINKKRSNSSQGKSKIKQDANPFSYDTNFDITVKDGINDLVTLPRELIESELIQRGFQPDMTKALDTKFLVNTLRSGKHIIKKDPDLNDHPYNFPYFSEYRTTQTPFFDDTSDEILKKRKSEEEKKLEKEKEEEEDTFEKFRNLDPDEFKKLDSKNSTPDSNTKNFDANTPFSPMFNYHSTFHKNKLNFSLCMQLCSYGIDVDNLISVENDPDGSIAKSLEDDYSKYYSTEDIIFRNLVLPSISKDEV